MWIFGPLGPIADQSLRRERISLDQLSHTRREHIISLEPLSSDIIHLSRNKTQWFRHFAEDVRMVQCPLVSPLIGCNMFVRLLDHVTLLLKANHKRLSLDGPDSSICPLPR
ncbi:hypothetical protein TNCT_545171 [Trichonephila clavata]|uniref:Uncharacterized protein n=1 Tax=Trichonephila clavata TaxID=2740835 RepID=A0A8X6FRX6_TRICU|nr:hypothetical protein TNCT_545171 [Trichonephila clavata]